MVGREERKREKKSREEKGKRRREECRDGESSAYLPRPRSQERVMNRDSMAGGGEAGKECRSVENTQKSLGQSGLVQEAGVSK